MFGRKRRGSSSQEAGFHAESKNSGCGRLFLFVFGLPFFGMGAFFCWMTALSPLIQSLSSGDWEEVPCVILSSEVESHSSSDGTTYSVEITFRWQHQGVNYRGGSYDFSDVNSSGYDGKAEIVAQYPVGSNQRCYVDPSNPSQAVLDRGIPWLVWIMLPFSGVFMLIGLACMVGGLGLFPRSWKPTNRHKPVASEDAGRQTLKPKHGGLTKLFIATCACLFWNGIVSVFVWQAVKGFQEGNPEWFLVVFLIPFVLIGLGLIGAIFYFILALGNPRPELVLEQASPRLGESTQLSWTLVGGKRLLDSFEILLIGEERATYRRGTDSVTDVSIFSKQYLIETTTSMEMQTGTVDLHIPANLMHSFQGGNNEIVWKLRVRGKIRRWPDIRNDFPITIRPMKLEQNSHG